MENKNLINCNSIFVTIVIVYIATAGFVGTAFAEILVSDAEKQDYSEPVMEQPVASDMESVLAVPASSKYTGCLTTIGRGTLPKGSMYYVKEGAQPWNNCVAGDVKVSFVNATYVDTLEERIARIESLLNGVERSGNDVIFNGINVHIRSGSGKTDGAVNGRGNLIVGYNEPRGSGNYKTGSHNVIIGSGNNYRSYGGLVAGSYNDISGAFASVSGGDNNTASGWFSSISGGYFNIANGSHSSISGGGNNIARELRSSVSGGDYNKAWGMVSWVGGGYNNTAYGTGSSVSGGDSNLANELDSSVSGGKLNIAGGRYSSVSGGEYNTASGWYSSVSGGTGNKASNFNSSISGGVGNIASGDSSSVSGGDGNAAVDFATSLGGGRYRVAGGWEGGAWDWAAGSLWQDS